MGSSINRRDLLATLAGLTTLPFLGSAAAANGNEIGNFRYVYSDPDLRRQFLDFLTNVFHLFPEDEFHNVLTRLIQNLSSDEHIYAALQSELDEIKPFLGALRYAIPALNKQKAIMGDQTLMLLDTERRYDGHLEIGSTGRYVGALEDRLDIGGDVFLLHTAEPGYGPEDIVERGQLARVGTYVEMGDYSTDFSRIIPPNSLDLVTVFIGFHHCPVATRTAFISAVRDLIRPGGRLILRDHDAHNEDVWRIAALAHDTFNAGTDESWQFNADERRNFYSLAYIIDFLENLGLRHDGQLFFQRGDPTRNGLTAFTRV